MKKFYSRFVSKKLLIVLLSFICAGRLWADTPKTGTIGNETWDITGSPYVLAGTITVTGTLTIEPGVKVMFPAKDQGGLSLNVTTGTLIAKGKPDSVIIFEGGGIKLDGSDYRNYQSGPITIAATSIGSVLQYVTIENMGYGYNNTNNIVEDNFPAALNIASSSFMFSHCTVQNTRGTGVKFTNQSNANTPAVTSNIFLNNYVGLQFTSTSPIVDSNSFNNNVYPNNGVHLDLITELDNLSKLVANDSMHIGLTSNLVMTSNATFTSYNYDYRLMAGLTIPKTLTIQPAAKVIFPSQEFGGLYLYITGKLSAIGTPGSGTITFQGGGSKLDGSDYRNYISGPVKIETQALPSTLQYVAFNGLGTGYNYTTDSTACALRVQSSSCSVTHCTFDQTRGTGAWFEFYNSKDVADNIFSNNRVGIKFSNNSGYVYRNTFPNNIWNSSPRIYMDMITELDNLSKLDKFNQLYIGLTHNLIMALDDTLNGYNYDYRLLSGLTVTSTKTLTAEAGSHITFLPKSLEDYFLMFREL